MPTVNNQPARLLTINTGSSSLKAARYRMAAAARRELAIQIERIGADDARMRIIGTDGAALLDTQQGPAEPCRRVARTVRLAESAQRPGNV